MRVTVNPVRFLSPITLLERGELTHITGLSYSAGQVPLKVSNSSHSNKYIYTLFYIYNIYTIIIYVYILFILLHKYIIYTI